MSADTPETSDTRERWDARQRALLEAMGVVVWAPAAAPVAAQAAAPPAPAAEPVRAAPPPRPPQPVVRAAPATAPAAREAAAAPVAPSDTAPPLGERAQRIATLDWPALHEAVAGCQACGLHGTRKQTVFGVGHEQAHWMIVGEAPGEQEDLQGEPFVGPAGQLLDAMLRAVGRSRLEGDADGDAAQRVFIANTLKCRPPRNRNPAPDELQHCEPFLQRQIALVRPRLILAMGKFAIQQLTGSDEPVGRLRGRVHRYQGVPVVVTYHPAYLLRQPGEKAKAWDDLRLALRVDATAATSAP
jgi:uracil-DNA glycosylase